MIILFDLTHLASTHGRLDPVSNNAETLSRFDLFEFSSLTHSSVIGNEDELFIRRLFSVTISYISILTFKNNL